MGGGGREREVERKRERGGRERGGQMRGVEGRGSEKERRGERGRLRNTGDTGVKQVT